MVTRAVYVQEVNSAERTARRRARMEARYGSVLEAANGSRGQESGRREAAEVVELGVNAANRSRREHAAGS